MGSVEAISSMALSGSASQEPSPDPGSLQDGVLLLEHRLLLDYYWNTFYYSMATGTQILLEICQKL